MSYEMALGKLYLSASGKATSREAVEAASKLFKGIAKGQPKGVKKQFYKSLGQFLQNPDNKAAEQVIRDTIGKSKGVAQYVEAQNAARLEQIRQEAVVEARKLYAAEREASAKFENLYQRSFGTSYGSRQSLEEFTNDFVNQRVQYAQSSFKDMENGNRRLVAISTTGSILNPVKVENATKQMIKRVMSDVKSMEIVPTIDLLPDKEKAKIVNYTLKEVQKEMLTLAGRQVMFPINGAISLFAPRSVKSLYKSIGNASRENFGRLYYEALVKQKGLLGRAPSEPVILGRSAGLRWEEMLGIKMTKYEGGFNPLTNGMEFTREFPTLPWSVQANLLTHELKHFEQADSIIRTFGVDKYINALKNSKVKELKTLKQYAGKTEKELRKIVNDMYKEENFEQKIRESFKQSIQAQSIDPQSEAGIRAGEYLKALDGYVQPKRGIMTTATKEYYENPMEKEAYAVGKKSRFWAHIFENLNLKTV